MAEAGKVPVTECVGAALRFVRANLRLIATMSALGALAGTLFSAIGLFVAPLSLPAMLASGLAQAIVYAAFIRVAMGEPDLASQRLVGDGLLVWAAMAVIGFFLFIVLTLGVFAAAIALAAGPIAPYISELQAAGDDQEAVVAIMVRFSKENPGALLALTAFFGGIWLLLTSRLYLAAPASIEAKRVMVFDTWKATKGAMLRICAARLLLLLPAYLLVSALSYLFGRALGIDTMDFNAVAAAAQANPVGVLGYTLGASFVTLAAYSSFEAGLSAYLYQGLKPAQPASTDS